MHKSPPRIKEDFGSIPEKFGRYDLVLRPDEDQPEWWAGAPSVARDPDGVFWMACRMRTADSPLGKRGYEIRLLRSEDGVGFEPIHSIRREDVPIAGFERPALLIEPNTGLFRLYGCGPWKNDRWCILRFDDAESPADFVPSSARSVIEPCPPAFERDVPVEGHKDPVLFHDGESFHCYTIGTRGKSERTYHFSSEDGESWTPVGSPYESIMCLGGWHDFFVRPACVVPLGAGYLFVYEGSNSKWYDPVYNIGTGLAFTFDLHRIFDLTPGSPLLLSSTPSARFATFRYSSWLRVDNQLWVYAETTCPNETNEIRLYRLDLS